jgi:hypothetical protein
MTQRTAQNLLTATAIPVVLGQKQNVKWFPPHALKTCVCACVWITGVVILNVGNRMRMSFKLRPPYTGEVTPFPFEQKASSDSKQVSVLW